MWCNSLCVAFHCLWLEGCNHSTIMSKFYVVHVCMDQTMEDSLWVEGCSHSNIMSIDCRDLTMAAQENRLLLGSTIRHEEVTLRCYPPISWQPILSHIITGYPCQSSSRYCLVSEQATSHSAAHARSYLWAWLLKNGPQEAPGFNPHWPSGKSLTTTHTCTHSVLHN